MNLKRPLLFIYPLSPSLQKYLEYAKETAAEENFDIYELDILGEALQLVPTVGPSLILGSSPKKVAQVLQSTHKILHQYSSKVLLLTDKALPQKLVQKLQKIGLTEYLQEPVNPKTLIYKVGLLLKALPQEEETKEEQAEEVIFGTDEVIDVKEKQRIEKGIIADEEPSRSDSHKSDFTELEIISNDKPTHENVVLELSSKAPESLLSELKVEDELNEHSELAEETDAEKKSNHIDTYYKNIEEKSNNLTLDIKVQPVQKKGRTKHEASDAYELLKTSEDPLSIDNSHSRSEDIGEEKEGPINTAVKESSWSELQLQKEKKQIEDTLQLTASKNKAKPPSSENDSSNTSETVSNKAQTDLVTSQAEQEDDLQLEVEAEQIKRKLEQSIENEKRESEIISDNMTDLLVEKESKKESEFRLEIAKKQKLEDQQMELSKKNMGIKHLDEVNIDVDLYAKPTRDASIDIDENIRKKAKQEKKDDQEAVNVLETAKGLKLSSEDAEAGEDSIASASEDPLVLSDSKKLKLTESQKDDDLITTIDLEVSNKSDDSSLSIDAAKNKKKDHGETIASSENIKVEDSETVLHLDRTSAKNRNESELVLSEGPAKEKQKDEKNYDWGKLNKPTKEEYDQQWISKRQKQTEIFFDTDKHEGETIDYRKLKKAFESAPLMDQNRGDKRDIFSKDHFSAESDQLNSKKEKDKFEDILLQQGAKEEEDTKESNIYTPQLNGTDHLIRTLLMYQGKRTEKQILFHISNILYRQANAYGGFFLMEKENEVIIDKEIFSSVHNVEYTGDRTEYINQWEKEKDLKRLGWKTTNIPKWDDDTFQSLGNCFVYPFYEGIDHLGHAVFIFPDKVTSAISSQVEMLIEGARAIYLEKVRQKSTSSGVKEDGQEEEKKGKGFFSRLLGGKK